MKKIFIVLIAIFLMNCNNPNIEGKYYEANDQLIFEFDKSEVIIYNLIDSIKESYSIKMFDSEIVFMDNANQEVTIEYVYDENQLILFDYNLNLTQSEKIFLKQLKHNKNIDIDKFYNNYWKSEAKLDTIPLILKVVDSTNKGFEYRVQASLPEDILFDSKIYIDKFNYFNKFYVYKFHSSSFADTDYLVENIDFDSLTIMDLNSCRRFKFSKYKSQLNENLFGNWKSTINSNIRNASRAYENPSLVFFGERFIIKKNNTIEIKHGANIREVDFDLGLDSKYIFIDELDFSEFKIIESSSNYLIIENPIIKNESGKPKLMRYLKIDSLDHTTN